MAILDTLTLPKIKSLNVNITGQWISQFKNRTTGHYVGKNSAFSLFPKSAKVSLLAYLSYPWTLNPRHRGNNFTILVEGFMYIKSMHFSYFPLLWIERRICSKLKFTMHTYWPCAGSCIPDSGIMNFDVLVEGFVDIKIMQDFMHLRHMSIWSHNRVWIPDKEATNFTIIIMHFLFSNCVGVKHKYS